MLNVKDILNKLKEDERNQQGQFPPEKYYVQYNIDVINDGYRGQYDGQSLKLYGRYDSIIWPLDNIQQGKNLYVKLNWQLINATTVDIENIFKYRDTTKPLYLYINRVYHPKKVA